MKNIKIFTTIFFLYSLIILQMTSCLDCVTKNIFNENVESDTLTTLFNEVYYDGLLDSRILKLNQGLSPLATGYGMHRSYNAITSETHDEEFTIETILNSTSFKLLADPALSLVDNYYNGWLWMVIPPQITQVLNLLSYDGVPHIVRFAAPFVPAPAAGWIIAVTGIPYGGYPVPIIEYLIVNVVSPTDFEIGQYPGSSEIPSNDPAGYNSWGTWQAYPMHSQALPSISYSGTDKILSFEEAFIPQVFVTYKIRGWSSTYVGMLFDPSTAILKFAYFDENINTAEIKDINTVVANIQTDTAEVNDSIYIKSSGGIQFCTDFSVHPVYPTFWHIDMSSTTTLRIWYSGIGAPSFPFYIESFYTLTPGVTTHGISTRTIRTNENIILTMDTTNSGILFNCYQDGDTSKTLTPAIQSGSIVHDTGTGHLKIRGTDVSTSPLTGDSLYDIVSFRRETSTESRLYIHNCYTGIAGNSLTIDPTTGFLIETTSTITDKENLTPYTFTDPYWITKIINFTFNRKNDTTKKKELGNCAEQLEEVFPDDPKLIINYKKNGKIGGFKEFPIICGLIECNKNLKQRVDELENTVSSLSIEINELKKIIMTNLRIK